MAADTLYPHALEVRVDPQQRVAGGSVPAPPGSRRYSRLPKLLVASLVLHLCVLVGLNFLEATAPTPVQRAQEIPIELVTEPPPEPKEIPKPQEEPKQKEKQQAAKKPAPAPEKVEKQNAPPEKKAEAKPEPKPDPEPKPAPKPEPKAAQQEAPKPPAQEPPAEKPPAAIAKAPAQPKSEPKPQLAETKPPPAPPPPAAPKPPPSEPKPDPATAKAQEPPPKPQLAESRPPAPPPQPPAPAPQPSARPQPSGEALLRQALGEEPPMQQLAQPPSGQSSQSSIAPPVPGAASGAPPLPADQNPWQAVAVPSPTEDGDLLVAYKTLVFSKLELAKRFPEEARKRHAHGSAVIEFALDDQGKVKKVTLVESSGDPALDAESQALVERAAPFPVPPPGAQKEFAAVIEFDASK